MAVILTGSELTIKEKNMEQEILKIVKKYDEAPFSRPSECAKEITAHVFKFTEWAVSNCVKLWNKENIYQETETRKTFKGLEELYQYWRDNVKIDLRK